MITRYISLVFSAVAVWAAVIAGITPVLYGCSSGSSEAEAAVNDTVYVVVKEKPVGRNPYDRHLDSMPDDECVKMKINPVGVHSDECSMTAIISILMRLSVLG